jgi:hypothetical protein
MSIRTIFCIALLLPIIAATVATAQYEIPWHTVDGGGATFSTGGTFSLGGTIGQPDAGSFTQPMAGGTFELVGGFWAPSADACPCLGDMNGDGKRDGLDVQTFVKCMTIGGSCSCADVDTMQGLSTNDVPAFVAQLLSGATCP